MNFHDYLRLIHEVELTLVVYVGDDYCFEGTAAELYKVLTINLMNKLKVVNRSKDGSTVYIDTEVVKND